MSDVPPDNPSDEPSTDPQPSAPPPYPGSAPPPPPPPPPAGPPPYPGGGYPTTPPVGPPGSGGTYTPSAGYPQAPGSGYGGPGYPPPPPPPGYYPQGGYQAPDLAGGSPYASYGARVGGWLIDFLILGVVGALLNAIFNAAHVTRVTITSNTTTHGVTVHHVAHFSILGPIVQVLIVLLYGAFFCGSRRGQTLGMMAVGARAVDRDTGTPIGFARALGRAAFEYLMFIIILIPWIIDMLFPAWDRKRQTLHDKVSKTVVVKASLYPPPAPPP